MRLSQLKVTLVLKRRRCRKKTTFSHPLLPFKKKKALCPCAGMLGTLTCLTRGRRSERDVRVMWEWCESDVPSLRACCPVLSVLSRAVPWHLLEALFGWLWDETRWEAGGQASVPRMNGTDLPRPMAEWWLLLISGWVSRPLWLSQLREQGREKHQDKKSTKTFLQTHFQKRPWLMWWEFHI